MTQMPSRHRFAVPVTLEFFSPSHLRISPVANLEPHTVLTLRDVRPELLLGNDALQIPCAHLLEERHSRRTSAKLRAGTLAVSLANFGQAAL